MTESIISSAHQRSELAGRGVAMDCASSRSRRAATSTPRRSRRRRPPKPPGPPAVAGARTPRAAPSTVEFTQEEPLAARILDGNEGWVLLAPRRAARLRGRASPPGRSHLVGACVQAAVSAYPLSTASLVPSRKPRAPRRKPHTPSTLAPNRGSSIMVSRSPTNSATTIGTERSPVPRARRARRAGTAEPRTSHRERQTGDRCRHGAPAEGRPTPQHRVDDRLEAAVATLPPQERREEQRAAEGHVLEGVELLFSRNEVRGFVDTPGAVADGVERWIEALQRGGHVRQGIRRGDVGGDREDAAGSSLRGGIHLVEPVPLPRE